MIRAARAINGFKKISAFSGQSSGPQSWIYRGLFKEFFQGIIIPIAMDCQVNNLKFLGIFGIGDFDSRIFESRI